MASINLIESFTEFKEAENIDRPTLMKVLEDVFKTLLRKKYGSDENFDVIVNTEKGDLEILRRRTIVTDGEVEDDNAQIAYSDAIIVEPDYQVGEDLYEEVEIHGLWPQGYPGSQTDSVCPYRRPEKEYPC